MKKGIIALFTVSALLMLSVSAAAFYDTADDEYGRAAENLAMYGIISGKGDGYFCPDDYLKRSEMAKIAVKVADEELIPSFSSLFYDVSPDYWANAYINTSAQKKLLMGYPDGSFCPEDNLTYAEAITVILRLLGYSSSDLGGNYPIAYLDKAYDLGLTAGMDYLYYDPIDRKNLALILSRALLTDKNGSSDDLIKQLDFDISDEVIIIPNYLTAADEVSTSDGIYKTLTDTSRYMGQKVKLILNDDNEVVAVSPVSGAGENVTVQNIIENDITYTAGNNYDTIRLDNNTKVYYQNSAMSFSSVKSEITPGMKMQICRNGNIIDYVLLYDNELSGPYIVKSSLDEFGIDEGRQIMKNGIMCDKSVVEVNNVIYYDNDYIYVYDNKVTGVYNKALPYKSDVKSITLSGTDYSIETQEAADKLGNKLGAFAINDYITLILGKDGKIADVRAAKDAGERYPIVTILGNDIVYIKNSKIGSITADNNWRINYNDSETTFAAIKNKTFENALFTVFTKPDGSFDYGVIDEYDLKGPKTVTVSNMDNLFDYSSSPRVIRDGKDAELSSLKPDDIAYYSDIQNTLYVYCDSELGVFEDAYPNTANAQSIKLSGTVYNIENKEVLEKLKMFDTNDYMTVLLGRDGRIADIKTSSGDYSTIANEYGILLSCRAGMDDGTRAYYASFITQNGKEVEYKTDKLYEDYIGRSAKLVFDSGILIPEILRNSSLSGDVDKANRRICGRYLADNATLIDIGFIPSNDEAKDGYPASAKKIELSDIRLNTLSKGQVIAEEYNSDGDIAFIAFDNITNSRYKYGMVTDYTLGDSSSSYSIDIGGTVKKYTSAIKNDIGRVPVMANIQKGKLLNISSLAEVRTKGSFVAIDKQRVKIGDESYNLDKDFVIYTKDKNRDWSPVDIDDIDDIDKEDISSVKLYSDKDLARGGIVRIVVINAD